MPIVVSYEDVGNLGSAAINAGYQSSFGQNAAQARQSALSRQQADTHMLMNQAFTRQNMDRQAEINAASQSRAQAFQGEQAALDRGVQQQGLDLRAQEMGAHLDLQRANIQQDYDLQAAREAEAARNDARDFENKKLFEQLRVEHGEAAANKMMQRKFEYDKTLDQYKNDQARERFANAAVNSGQAANLQEGYLLYDRNQVDRADRQAHGTNRGRGGAGDLLGTLSGDVVQNAILAFKEGKGVEYLKDLEGKGSGRELPYNRRISISAMYAAASNPNETSDLQIARAAHAAAEAGDQEMQIMLQKALRDRVAWGANQRSHATSGGPMPGMGGGAAPPTGIPIGPKPVDQMTGQELMQEYFNSGGG